MSNTLIDYYRALESASVSMLEAAKTEDWDGVVRLEGTCAVLIEQLKADGFDPSKMRLPPELWFAAGEGLRMIRALVEHIIANLNHFRQPNPLVRELKAVETLLVAAEIAGVRFHFTRMDV